MGYRRQHPDEPRAAAAWPAPLVLLVDDDEAHRALCVRLLGQQDYRFAHATSGAQAVEVCQALQPDCVLLDYRLPDLNGLEVLDLLLGQPHSSNLAVIVLTVAESRRAAVAAMKAGALDYLQKLELNRDTLQRAVRMALQQSRLRQLEARLQHKERRDAMGQLAASVAHEINNPASCLLNNMTVALERVTELKQRHVAAPESTSAKLLDELDECIRDSLAGVRSISQVTKDFGDLAHSGPKQRVCLNLSELAEHTVKLLAAKAGGRCELTVQAACGPHVLGNRSQLMQAIMNLVDNAIEAIPPGAPDQNWVRVSVTATATSVRLHVDDSGSGVPEPLLPRLFEPFFTTKPRGQGVGLALTLTQSIARAHAGRLEFERLLGGSRFSLVLPRDCHDRSRLSRPAVPRAEPSGGKLLIIDDEGAVLRSLKRVLQTHYEVITAANAKSAYAAANTHDFDAVLCDLSMPGEDGVDVFRHLSEAHPQLARTLMFLSAASASDGLRQKAITTCRPVLSKPIEAQKLIEAIERCKFERGPGADSSAPPA